MNSDDLPLFAAPSPRLNTPEKSATGAAFGGMAAESALSVTELNRRVKGVLEARFELCWVRGELSNVVRAASGHWYFVLKDADAQVRCVMFRQRAQAVSFTPQNGMEVEVRALPSLYEARGEFQLGVEGMRRAGVGALHEAFERLKARLAAEGLFDPARKLPLPAYPAVVGIVTSLAAAALRDVLTTFKRRAPHVRLVIYPAAVQGADAPEELARALAQAAARREVDVLLVCRGGGSAEDLWSFNDERVARAIDAFRRETLLPVVSAVGHETDFTIADFVADMRAPTPTAGAELISPDAQDLRRDLTRSAQRLTRLTRDQLARLMQRVDIARRGLVSPQAHVARLRDTQRDRAARLARQLGWAIEREHNRMGSLAARWQRAQPDPTALRALLVLTDSRLQRTVRSHLAQARDALNQRERALALLDPAQVLGRGYAMVERMDASVHRTSVVTASTQVTIGDALRVRWRDGSAAVRVDEVSPPTSAQREQHDRPK
jgi:exodeoxyribonuclease VII large subunit